MKNNILVVAKKELFRFFKDKRILLNTVLLPGISIYIMYNLMGAAFFNLKGPEKVAHTINLPPVMEKILTDKEITFTKENSLEATKDLKDGEVVISFPENFMEEMESYNVSSGNVAPNIGIYYDGAESKSRELYNEVVDLFNDYETTISNKFNINQGDEVYNLATEKEMNGEVVSQLLPMLLLIFLFSSCLTIAPESISGEKERGTLATMLVTPLKRSELVLGKVVAIVVISLLSATSSFTGTILSFPKLMGGNMEISYGIYEYLLLSVIILSSVLLMVFIISLISAYAKTIREAQTMAAPLTFVVIIASLAPMMGDFSNIALYLIPIFNSTLVMVDIFSFNISTTNIFVTVASNMVYCVLLLGVLVKMFGSERIMFSR
ncbi:MAG: ABC transporter permease [Lachnospirales bacterium]